jgi:hypothetical protein
MSRLGCFKNVALLALAAQFCFTTAVAAERVVFAEEFMTAGIALTPLFQIGDMNCDDVINFDDINPFVLALSDPAEYQIEYPDCDIMLADINQDGVVDFYDIDAWLDVCLECR